MTALQAGKTVEAPPALAALFRPSVQPYLISWFKYVPSVELARLTIPVLIIQGTTDIQVPVAEAKALQAAKPEAQLVIVDGMNHVHEDGDAIRQNKSPRIPIRRFPSIPTCRQAIGRVRPRARGARPRRQPRRPTAQRGEPARHRARRGRRCALRHRVRPAVQARPA